MDWQDKVMHTTGAVMAAERIPELAGIMASNEREEVMKLELETLKKEL